MTLSLSPFDYAHGDPEVLEGSTGQDGQPLQHFEGIDQEVRGAIRPRVPELQHDLPLGRQTEPVLRDGWPQRITGRAARAGPAGRSGPTRQPRGRIPPGARGIAPHRHPG
jgi:hypothetical protein